MANPKPKIRERRIKAITKSSAEHRHGKRPQAFPPHVHRDQQGGASHVHTGLGSCFVEGNFMTGKLMEAMAQMCTPLPRQGTSSLIPVVGDTAAIYGCEAQDLGSETKAPTG
jgi:hypothetical protein